MHVEKFFDRNLGDLGIAHASGPAQEGESRTLHMNDTEKSDRVVVPTKPANKRDETRAEQVEGRMRAKGNAHQTTADRTQSRVSASSGLAGVRKAAKQDKGMRFTALLHHITVDQLRQSYFALKRLAAPGIDGVTWEHYGSELDGRLRELHERLHKGSYRARPARRVFIAKADGSERALSVWCLEDKIVQQALIAVLNAVYEVDFQGFSYGFRPGRGQHDALDALSVGLTRRRVNWVLDTDIQSFFDKMSHDWILQFLQHRIGDHRVLRLIRKWLTVGIMTDNGRLAGVEGAPQGAVISPLLANIYLHYVLDLWTRQWRSRNARGDVIIVRYADDVVLGFEFESEGRRYERQLQDRLAAFGLNLHPDKTQLIRFGRLARQNQRQLDGGKPPTFDFLGFTHYCTISRAYGHFVVGRKTIKKRMVSSVKEIKRQLRVRLHDPIGHTGEWLRRVVQGHLNYFAVPGNSKSLQFYLFRVRRYWLRSLRRRSQRTRMNWERFRLLCARFLPPIRITHPGGRQLP